MQRNAPTRRMSAASRSASRGTGGFQGQSQSGRSYEAALAELDAAGERVTLLLDGARVTLTHLDKVLWPADEGSGLRAYTRRDHLRYLLRVGPFLLRHAAHRPLTLIRMPEGIARRRFVQFHWEQRLPEYVECVDIYSENRGESESYLLCNNMPTLLWLAHVGVLELHVWHSRAQPGPDARGAGTDYASSLASLDRSLLDFPDYLVFDLDPYIYAGSEKEGEQPAYNPAAWERTKALAFALKALLESMNLHSRVKTSGRTGLHVLVPIERTVSYDVARALSKNIGRHLMREHPSEVTMSWAVKSRTGRVFMDYNMNARVKTLSAPYSVRGLPGAPVSMPLAWEALANATPLDYTMDTVPDRLERAGDIWEDMLEAKQDVQRALSGS